LPVEFESAPSQTRSASMSLPDGHATAVEPFRIRHRSGVCKAEQVTGGHLEEIVPSWRKVSRLVSVEGRLGREGQLIKLHMAAANVVIVRRGHFATFELLMRIFADDPMVQIIWDRRIGERRQNGARTLDADRRRTDRRRTAPTQWTQLNYYMIAGEMQH
jgi:hypothetical protein